jgi:hypothetical protein
VSIGHNEINVDPAFGCCHRVDDGCVANVSDEHAFSTFRGEVCSYILTVNHRESFKSVTMKLSAGLTTVHKDLIS